jgi:hypothetical protein
MTILLFVYFSARLFLLVVVQTLALLQHQLPNAFIAVDWTKYVSHILIPWMSEFSLSDMIFPTALSHKKTAESAVQKFKLQRGRRLANTSMEHKVQNAG